jgi:hypothetical protein
MNSSAFSCGESAVRVEQQPGNTLPALVSGSPGKSADAASVTCKAVYTNFPHWADSAAPIGVLKEK